MGYLLVFIFSFAAALVAITLSVANPASADPRITYTCPDGYLLVPAITAPKQDRNGDGFVCEKSTSGSSGPDDAVGPSVVDDTIL